MGFKLKMNARAFVNSITWVACTSCGLKLIIRNFSNQGPTVHKGGATYLLNASATVQLHRSSSSQSSGIPEYQGDQLFKEMGYYAPGAGQLGKWSQPHH